MPWLERRGPLKRRRAAAPGAACRPPRWPPRCGETPRSCAGPRGLTLFRSGRADSFAFSSLAPRLLLACSSLPSRFLLTSSSLSPASCSLPRRCLPPLRFFFRTVRGESPKQNSKTTPEITHHWGSYSRLHPIGEDKGIEEKRDAKGHGVPGRAVTSWLQG